MSDFQQIRYEVADRVATITLDRPTRHNAFTPVMRYELHDALELADGDDGVRAVVVTGEGRSFCAGADLGDASDKPFSYARADHRDSRSDADTVEGLPRDGGGVVSLRVAQMRKPVIAAINGAAIGVGITMTLPMDIRIAAESARFGFVFARRGIAPEATSSWFLPRVVGISQAMDWTLTGRVFGAQEAREGGLVSRVVPDAELLDVAHDYARQIADATSAPSIAATRAMLWSSLSENDPWVPHVRETQIIHALKQGPDAAEGVTSFLEKRDAVFRAGVNDGLPEAVPTWPVLPLGPTEGSTA
ncbi:enoyl-CoA hydratase-related protein [Mumia sp. DW29H23]|uniref:enoyl-CoA hydratase-related protein n=1 Tax=Mumia sp. DW29H23 TaxID=3421241 RepID=UPI003D693003